ncbi:uroporphyrinogen-III synthase [Caloramator sp. mosi_1]|nr:uroporphyrinogen-III synthase [Caloramator sp. mosi_1]WDC84903.1 uroporphyrinogen-III synthase [Caloramator sp. mosi_1]
MFEQIKDKISKGEKILIPRAKGAREFLVDSIRNIGAKVDEVYIYELDLEDKREHIDCDIYTFTSPSTFRNFVKLYGKEILKDKEIVAIGPITGKEIEKEGFRAKMPKEYTVDGIIQTVLGGF